MKEQPKIRTVRLEDHIREANRKHVNRDDPDPHSAELGRRLGTQPEVNPFFAYTNLLPGELNKLSRKRHMLSRTDVLTKRFVAQEEEIDKDKDMAGPVAIERSLLFLRNIATRFPGKPTTNDILMFMLVTGHLAITTTEASKLMNITTQNGLYIVRKLLSNGYIEVNIQGGPGGPRRFGKMISGTYVKGRRGLYLWDVITENFDTRKFGAIADIMDEQLRSIPVDGLMKSRSKQVDLTQRIPLDIPDADSC